MLRVALTGGIATGKSRVLARIAAAGIPTIDADALARDVVRAGTPAYGKIRERFGTSVITAGGDVDRRALAAIVFSDADARAALEAIVHPAVYQAIADWFADLTSRPGTPLAVADIPLLFETGRAGEFDRVIVTVCTPEEQIRRIRVRDGATQEEAAQRVAAQWPADEKARRAHLLIDTRGTLADTDRRTDEVLRALLAETEGFG